MVNLAALFGAETEEAVAGCFAMAEAIHALTKR